MCGIMGIYNANGANADLVERMASRMAHRGPDGFGMTHDGALAFGALRLAIIDLSAPAGPIFNEDGAIGIVFNGEIYNYRELMAELKRAGHHFNTQTDTEVIVHGYEEWGDDVISRLRGMFALGIWDSNRQRLLLARDRLGEKPLYYLQKDDGEFLFSSEIKGFFAHPGVRRAVNHDALPYYLTLGYTPPPQTMFAGINKLGPGQLMVVNQDGIAIRQYWKAAPDTTQTPEPYPQAVKSIRAALEDAVVSRMISDVPVGAFLSGGMDSTAVVALMQRVMDRPLQTFTVGFGYEAGSYGDEKFNVDTRYASIAAKHIGTDHRAIILKDESISEIFPYLVQQMDEPIAQHAIVQTAYITALARHSGIPVLLTGEAGDEMFLGYNHYRADQKLQRILAIPRLLRKGILAPLLDTIPLQNGRFRNLALKMRNDDPVRRYLEWMRIIRLEMLPELLINQTLANSAYDRVADTILPLLMTPKTRDFADRIAYTSLYLSMIEDGNMRVDKMSMLMSVESRSPLEDHLLVQQALSLPMRYKIRGEQFKMIFKEAMRDLLPPPILERSKWGFSPPSSDWLRTTLRPHVDQWLSPAYVESVGIAQPEVVSRLIHEHDTREGYHLWPLWSLLMLHMWHALYIDESLSLSDTITPATLVDNTVIQAVS